MSTSERDQDLWKLRQLTKAKNALFSDPCSREEEVKVRTSVRFVELQAEFDALFLKYGNNSSIFNDSERAGSKRHGARRIKKVVNRRTKRSDKQQQRSEIAEESDRVDAQQ